MNNTIFNAETRRRGDIDKAENKLADTVIDAAIEVHRVLGGPGLLESLAKTRTLTYLRLTGLKLGFVINFGQKMLVDGVARVVNGL